MARKIRANFPRFGAVQAVWAGDRANPVLLEGIAFNAQSMEATPSSMAAEELIGWLKSSLRELFDDVALSKAALRDPQR